MMLRVLLLIMALVLTTAPAHGAGKPVLLAVFAHPDDEILVSGFLMEAARRGIAVRAVYVTSGDAGQDRSGRNLSGASLRVERERELATAYARLALPRPGLLRYPDGQVWPNRDRVTADLSRILEEYRPRWVLAFGPDGVTGHQDHIASGVAAAAAFDRTGIGAELWNFAASDARTAEIGQHLKQFEVRPIAHARVHRTVDVRAHVGARIASMKAHHTQFPADVQELLVAWFTRYPIDELVRVRGVGPVVLPWEH
jgi:LmbE family N-acetylglucosaminyl deacetylase